MKIIFVIIGIIIFHIAYQAYLNRPMYDEYVCDHLMVKIYYGRAEQDTLSSFVDYETKSTIYLTIISMKEGTDQEIEEASTWHDVGRAVVRTIQGTDKIYQWWYLK